VLLRDWLEDEYVRLLGKQEKPQKIGDRSVFCRNHLNCATVFQGENMPEIPNVDISPLLPILNESSDGVALIWGSPSRLLYANPTLANWLGGVPSKFAGLETAEVFAAAGLLPLNQFLVHGRGGSELPASFPAELRLPSRTPMRVDIRLQQIVLDGKALVSAVFRRIPSESQQSAVDVIGRDPLTGLPDRSVLLARMTELLRGDRAADRQFAVLFIDLDNFKQVNDAQGHLVGDRVLVEVARRLTGCVRARDLIVRFGGDEFVALVEHVFCSAEVQPVVNRIDAALARPIALPVGEVILTASIGVAEASETHRTPEDLLREADRAMYASKRLPR
jgi:diguanylate cyclase (GGDEF)-like protein